MNLQRSSPGLVKSESISCIYEYNGIYIYI